ncbi:MAG: hypothetical protein IH605_06585 [Burkholderiales bacterium]|nr:hypothetical protein [Burkholderiales bacterium]
MANKTDDILRALRQFVQDDPVLQARLFGLTDASEFIAAVRQLAQTSAFELDEQDVLQAMRAGRKAWSDRKLP